MNQEQMRLKIRENLIAASLNLKFTMVLNLITKKIQL